ncbi:MAG: type II secretion system GspH family protein [Saccharofermentans sp.]|nr:type II secretion system GspH family protein [Saccharofermentans sp.]
MRRFNKTDKKGFTLIEIMLVVAIIVILASVGFMSIGDTIANAKRNESLQESKFQVRAQSHNDSVRRNMLSGTPHRVAAASTSAGA